MFLFKRDVATYELVPDYKKGVIFGLLILKY